MTASGPTRRLPAQVQAAPAGCRGIRQGDATADALAGGARLAFLHGRRLP